MTNRRSQLAACVAVGLLLLTRGQTAQGGCTATVMSPLVGTDSTRSQVASLSGDGTVMAYDVDEDTSDGDLNLSVWVFNRLGCDGELVSLSFSGGAVNGSSEAPSISDDGRQVAFVSAGSNIVMGDTNAATDVFVRDRMSGTNERISVDSNEVQANGASAVPQISGDGQYVVFWSTASNLVAGDTNNEGDIFIRDRVAGTTERVSVATGGGQGTSPGGVDGGWPPHVSQNGRYVVFSSSKSNLVAGDANGWPDVFLRDRQTDVTSRVSVSSTGVEGNNASGFSSVAVSNDGRFVAFSSQADNLVAGDDANFECDVFVRDTMTSTTTRVSVRRTGEKGKREFLLSRHEQ